MSASASLPSGRRTALSAPSLAFALVALVALVGGVALAGDEPQAATTHVGVIGSDGRPFAGALLVEASTNRDGALVFDPDATVVGRTGERGSVDLPNPTSGARLVAFAPDASAVLVARRPEGTLVLLAPAAPIYGALRFGALRSGDGKPPPPGLVVEAAPLDRASELVHRARTDATGAFAFPHVSPGRYRLRLERASGTTEDLGVVAAGAAVPPRTIERGATLKLEIRDGDGSGDMAAAGASIRLARLDRAAGDSAISAEAVADAKGRATIEGVPAGVYEATLLDPERLWDGAAPRVEVLGAGPVVASVWWVRRRGAISGRVVDAADGRPVADAAVVVAPPTDVLEPAGGFGGSATKSDATGAFRVGRLAAARGWRVLVAAPGYSPQVVSPVEVARDKTKEVPPVRLAKGWTLVVRVRDPEGRPVSGATVVAVPADRPALAESDPFAKGLLRAIETDATGGATFKDLPDADVLLRARAPSFVEASLVVPLPIGRKLLEQAVAIAPALSIAGRIVSATGIPAGIRVRAVSKATGRTTWVDPEPDGAFRVEGLSPAPVDLEAVLAGGNDALVVARVEGVLPGARETTVLDLAALRRVAGIVRGLSPAGPTARVRLEMPLHDPRREELRWVVAAEAALPAGETEAPFAFAAVPPGPCAVRVLQGLRDGGAVPVLVEGADVEGVDLSLPLGAHVEGRVVDGRRRVPGLGARVVLERLEGEGVAPRGATPPASTVADADGRFAFDDVPAGLWRVTVSDRDAAGATVDVRLVEGERNNLGTLTLSVGGAIEGRLGDKRGHGIAGVPVRVLRRSDLAQVLSAKTGEDGAFRAAPLEAGRYVLRVEDRPAKEPALEADAEVVEGETTKVDFATTTGAQLSGTVRRRGVVVPGVTLEATLDESCGCEKVVRRAVSDAFGKFRWELLPAGRYSLRTVDGGVEGARTVTLLEGDRVDRDVDLGEGRLQGSVRTSGGQPVRDAEVLARPAGVAGQEVFGRARTGPDGKFGLGGLPVGLYRLEVLPPGRPARAVEGAFADLPGSGRPVDVVLANGARLDLLVRDEGRRGIVAAEVWVEDAAGNALHARPYFTAPSGKVRIDGLPEGAARIRVRARGLARPRPVPVTLRDGATSNVEVVLRPMGSLRLVVAAGRDPAARARVDLLRLPEREGVEVRRPLRHADEWGGVGLTSRVGVLVVDELDEGDYLIVVSAGNEFEGARIPVRVKRGETVEARAVLAFRRR